MQFYVEGLRDRAGGRREEGGGTERGGREIEEGRRGGGGGGGGSYRGKEQDTVCLILNFPSCVHGSEITSLKY